MLVQCDVKLHGVTFPPDGGTHHNLHIPAGPVVQHLPELASQAEGVEVHPQVVAADRQSQACILCHSPILRSPAMLLREGRNLKPIIRLSGIGWMDFEVKCQADGSQPGMLMI